jgi:hypothetical protein
MLVFILEQNWQNLRGAMNVARVLRKKSKKEAGFLRI